MTAQLTARRRSWLEIGEAGSVLGIRLVLLAATTFGRAPVRWLLRIIALYYALLHRTARRASRTFLQRIGAPAGFIAVYRHILRFAECSTDRLFLISGRTSGLRFERHGNAHLEALRDQKRGAILLGAHLGSFEAMHACGMQEDMTIHVVGYFRNARMINEVLEGLGGGVHARLVEAQPGSVDFVLKLRERIEAGEIIAMLGDRSVGSRSIDAPFLGEAAPFPVGPYMLAAMLGCPVYLTFGLYSAPDRYDVYCEPFAERIELPRGRRDEALEGYVRRYAARLEHYCRMAPDNWFNFYDFWRHGD